MHASWTVGSWKSESDRFMMRVMVEPRMFSSCFRSLAGIGSTWQDLVGAELISEVTWSSDKGRKDRRGDASPTRCSNERSSSFRRVVYVFASRSALMLATFEE